MFVPFAQSESRTSLAVVRSLLAVAAVTAAMSPAAVAGGGGEIGIGRTLDNRLVALVGFTPPKVIPRSVFAGFSGFATGAIGFENIPFDLPDEGAYALSLGSDISARVTHRDPGIEVRDGLVSVAVGGSMYFGPPFFDYHPVYTIPSPTAEHSEVFEIRMVLHDASGIYADSDEFAVVLTPACPADVDDGSALGTPDGGVGIEDLLYYLGVYQTGGPSADVDDGTGTGTTDGGIGIEDLLYYLRRFDAGC